MRRLLPIALLTVSLVVSQRAATATAGESTVPTHRLYDGLTAYVHNPSGEKFDVELDVRNINVFGQGPRELLFKVYDPDGRLVVREVIPDDGVEAKSFMPAMGGWHHEQWYYTLNYEAGSQPMLRWSSFSEPARLSSVPARRFQRPILAGKPGVYRVLVVGASDHFVTLRLSPRLRYGVCGHKTWLVGRGDMFRKSYVYVPKGTTSLFLRVSEPDAPQTRRVTLTAPDGAKLFDGIAEGGKADATVKFDPRGKYDDKLLTLEVSDGPGDYLLHLTLNNTYAGGNPRDSYFAGSQRGPTAVLAPDAETAVAVRGGAIYHDGEVFWHMFQVRFHDWLKSLKPQDLIVKDETGRVLEVTKLPPSEGNGWNLEGLPKRGELLAGSIHSPTPACDSILLHYPAHKNRQALNVALADMAAALRGVSSGDYQSVAGKNSSAGYIFSNYAWQYWRPAWRIIQQSDAPDEVKAIVREAFILCGDRLAFCCDDERSNGNVFSQIPASLRYCYEASGDPLQKQLFETYFERFASEGWGERTGISKSGDCQEHYAHEHAYGYYIMHNWAAPIADLREDRFQKILDRVGNLYSYTWCRDVNASPWSSRTQFTPSEDELKGKGVVWKGDGGPDFTDSVNGGNEWFAARRKNYYALTFHGRLSPMWMNRYFGNTRLGYGGGAICQVTVPGKGTVIASTLHDNYGDAMEPYKWPTLHIHSIVGRLVDGRPLISADSEHLDARLDGTSVASTGEARECPVRVTRRYTFGAADIRCEAELANSVYKKLRYKPDPEMVAEAYEMIPFVAVPEEKYTKVTALLDGQADPVELTSEARRCKTVIIDRGGYGVRVELDEPTQVRRGERSTILIQLIDKPTPVDRIAVRYRLVPFVTP